MDKLGSTAEDYWDVPGTGAYDFQGQTEGSGFAHPEEEMKLERPNICLQLVLTTMKVNYRADIKQTFLRSANQEGERHSYKLQKVMALHNVRQGSAVHFL